MSKEFITLKGHTADVQCVAFGLSNNLLASGGKDGVVHLWDIDKGEIVSSLTGHNRSVVALEFAPDGKTLVTADYSSIKIWDIPSATLNDTISAHDSWVYAISISSTKNQILSSGNDSRFKIWNIVDLKSKFSSKRLRSAPEAIEFAPDGESWAVSIGSSIELWDYSLMSEYSQLKGHRSTVKSLRFSGNGDILISGGYDKTIIIWDLESKSIIRTLKSHKDRVWCVDISPGNNLMASASWDGTVRIWDIATGSEIDTILVNSGYVFSVSFSVDGSLIASGCGEGVVKVWKV